MIISEVFGHGIQIQSEQAWADRNAKHCSFRDSPCTKSSIKNPIGICSLSTGKEAAALCPARFLEDDRIFTDAANQAFGAGVRFGVFPEVRILKLPDAGKNGADRKIGKVDFLLGKIENGQVVDFCAVEVQAVYFSGTTIRPPLEYYLKHRELDIANSERRPDFRSSAQKRLVPQLQLKVPVFRRWGKKFFVVVDTQFFRALPLFSRTTAGNSELTWLNYPIQKSSSGSYKLEGPEIIFSEWEDVINALREGVPPDPSEIIGELEKKLRNNRKRPKILET